MASLLFNVLALHAIFALSAPCNRTDFRPTATIDCGVVVGTTTSLPTSTVTVNKFLGIPFGAVPVRFGPPQPAPPLESIYDASEYKPSCIQKFNYPEAARNQSIKWYNTPGPPAGESEDCLNLNIFAPATAPDRPRAVLFWIYGGGFNQGSGSLPLYDGTSFATNHDVVVVTSNHRLNIFGFPGSPDMPEGERNLGWLDQHLALTWVQHNIAAFGGDPGRVTIMGESSGAGSVDALVTAPPNPPPFHAAIMQSGQATIIAPDNITALSWNLATKAFNCSSHNELECMRAVPPLVLKDAVERLGLQFGQVQDGGATWAESPRKDRLLSTDENPRIARVPVLIGSNADEGRNYAFGYKDAKEYISKSLPGGTEEQIDTLLAAYPLGAPEISNEFDRIAKIYTEVSFQCPAKAVSEDSAAVGINTWRYFFNASFPNSELFKGSGAHHIAEIRPVFGTFPREGATEFQADVSRAMQEAWARFAKDPNAGPGWDVVPRLAVFGGGARAGMSEAGREALKIGNASDIDQRCQLFQGFFSTQVKTPPEQSWIDICIGMENRAKRHFRAFLREYVEKSIKRRPCLGPTEYEPVQTITCATTLEDIWSDLVRVANIMVIQPRRQREPWNAQFQGISYSSREPQKQNPTVVEIGRWMASDAKMSLQLDQTFEKQAISTEDLRLVLDTLWAKEQDITCSPSARLAFRTAVVLGATGGWRPASLLRVKYKDVEIGLMRHPRNPQDVVVVAKGFCSIEDILQSEQLPAGIDYRALGWRDEFMKCEGSKETIPLKYHQFRDIWNRVLLVIGMPENPRIYALRVAFVATGQLTPALRNYILSHSSEVYERSYHPVHLQNNLMHTSFGELANGNDEILAAMHRVCLKRDPNAPIYIKQQDLDDFEKRNDITTLRAIKSSSEQDKAARATGRIQHIINTLEDLLIQARRQEYFEAVRQGKPTAHLIDHSAVNPRRRLNKASSATAERVARFFPDERVQNGLVHTLVAFLQNKPIDDALGDQGNSGTGMAKEPKTRKEEPRCLLCQSPGFHNKASLSRHVWDLHKDTIEHGFDCPECQRLGKGRVRIAKGEATLENSAWRDPWIAGASKAEWLHQTLMRSRVCTRLVRFDRSCDPLFQYPPVDPVGNRRQSAARWASGVDLAHVDSSDLWELLEDDPVEAHLARPEAEAAATGNRRSSAADFRACQ
ncbi:hypothetical protein AK830_g182 [Neonectria ditissima]|uniref:Carboxylesterase type B domain-containing protein n=1 Tax=Neonectria ditissima TaxID=78410 RepID=A0A0P7BQI7_9HYPO|nr:hypothetical protein AK830_g182 [Neonectria ditissima]